MKEYIIDDGGRVTNIGEVEEEIKRKTQLEKELYKRNK